jgi:hypothetical protein
MTIARPLTDEEVQGLEAGPSTPVQSPEQPPPPTSSAWDEGQVYYVKDGTLAGQRAVIARQVMYHTDDGVLHQLDRTRLRR